MKFSAGLFGKHRAWIPSLSDAAFIMPIAVLFLCTTGVSWLLADSDTGWHIRTGEWIIKNRCVPRTDIFSFTRFGHEWFAWEWLSDVGLGLLHRLGGLAAVVLGSLTVLCLTSAQLYKTVVGECRHRLVAIWLCWLCATASTVHWLARPHLVTPLMAILFCAILNRSERTNQSKQLWVLPLLMIVWVNLHGAFFVGIVLLAIYAVGTTCEELLRVGRPGGLARARTYLWTALGCGLSSLVNPYAYRLHLHVAEYLGGAFYLRVTEFESINFHTFTANYFETLLIVVIGATVWNLGRGRLVHAFLALFWTHLALFSARNIPIFAVVVAPGVGLAIVDWLEFAGNLSPMIWLSRLATSVGELEQGVDELALKFKSRVLHLWPCLGVLATALLLAHPGSFKAAQPVFDRKLFPVDAVKNASKELEQATRVYTSWQWGGFLIYRLWPTLEVFNDGRTDFYGPVFTAEGLRIWEVRPGWEGILEKYQIHALLLPVDCPLTGALLEERNWTVAYRDEFAILFERTLGPASALSVTTDQDAGRGE